MGALTNICNYKYGGLQPHAVSKINDATSYISTAPQHIDYTEFNKAEKITEDHYELNITYGPEHFRKKTELKENGQIITTRYYLGNYEKEIAGGVTKEYHYISGPTGLIAVYIIEDGVGKLYYTITDYLGSILVLTDKHGNIVEETNYDAWGRMRNPNTWTYTGAQPLSKIYRGFTGHEMLPHFALINMNGRMYDHVLGRMLSPDNFVQNPGNPQSYNRYSYALNNPLVYVDPDGEFIFTILAAIFCPPLLPVAIAADMGGFMNVAMNAENINNFGDFALAYGIGAGAGALGAGAGMGATALMTSAGIPGGILGGMAAGGTGGFVGGFVLGSTNSWVYDNSTFSEGLNAGLNMGIQYGIMGAIGGGVFGGIEAYNSNQNILTGEPLQRMYFYQEANGGTGTFPADQWDRNHLNVPSENASYVHNEIDLAEGGNMPSGRSISIPEGYTRNVSVNYDRLHSGQQIRFNVNNGQRIIMTPLNRQAGNLTINNIRTLNFSVVGTPYPGNFAPTRVHIAGFYNPLKYIFR